MQRRMARVAAAALVALLAALSAQTASAACASICSTEIIYGFSPGGATDCTCTGSAASDSCQCGVCYNKQSDGTVLAYALTDGTCTFGTDCTGCTASSSASGSAASSSTSGSGSSSTSTTSNSSSSSAAGTPSSAPTASPSPTPVLTNVSTSTATDAPTGSASLASSSSASLSVSASASASRDGDASGGSGDAGASAGSSSPAAGSSSSSGSSGGMETWQIALIICSAVLAFGVAVVSILTCYCKARRRLQETEEDEEDGYYHHPPRSGSTGSSLPDSGLSAALVPGHRPSSGHSQHGPRSVGGGGLKAATPLGADPATATYSSSYDAGLDRIGVGLPSRRSNASNGDLAGSFTTDRRPSQGSYSLGRRPSEEVYYSTRDRDAMAVEL